MAEINIKPEREYLHEIVSKIKKGIYGVPSFQRNFVWRKEQVLDLFDSILRGYPIGSILLWKPDDKQFPLKSRNIITDSIEEDSKPVYYILDGRQRLTSFYCSVLQYEEKKEIFNICYNLDKECFEYTKKSQIHIIPVSELYDTFIMLKKLQELMDYYEGNTEQAQIYVNRARKINSILQGYQIGEILLENCDINEASTVFSRLNSKGTDISKVSMLQAVFYKNKDDILIADSINEFINSLALYGFDSLKSDDILNCCYRYVGKSFYDSQLLKDLDKLDFISHWDEIKQDISNAVKFLNEDCYVISSKLLPYVKQLIALAGYFKEHKNPSEEQKLELKKWFFYTTYNQSFQNSSLSIVRSIFKRFEEYIKGEKCTAIDYESIAIGEDTLNFRYASGSALSNFMILSLVRNYLSYNPKAEVTFYNPIKLNGNDPKGVMPYFIKKDLESILSLCDADEHFYKSYAITSNMIKNITNKEAFCSYRGAVIIEIEQQLLESLGLVCTKKEK